MALRRQQASPPPAKPASNTAAPAPNVTAYAGHSAPETGEDGAQTNRPADPRKDPQVVRAVKLAGRQDPAIDPLKPIGRSSFVVWMVILLGSAAAMFWTWDTIDYRRIGGHALPFLQTFLMNGDVRADIFETVYDHPQSYLFKALQWAVILSGAAALYYIAIYLIGRAVLRGGKRILRSLNRNLVAPARHAIATSGHKSIAEVRRARYARANRHGPDPDAGQAFG